MKEQLILIPGTLCDAGLYAHQVDGLSNIANCKVVSNSSSDDLGKIAAKILEEAEDSFSLLGLSYGGILAFEILRQAPERVNKLILMNTNYKEPSETTRINQQRFLGMAYLGELKEVTSEILIDAMVHPKYATDESLREAIVDMTLNVGLKGFHNQVKAQLARPDSTGDLTNITCPTLIITGRQDNICPLQLHEDMQEHIPNASLKVIDECGHLSTLECPDKVNSIIINWWKNL